MAIQIKNAEKYYEDGAIELSNFNIDIADKEFILLTGLKGSGKTAVSKIIAGLEVPHSGEILINGKRVNEVPAQKRKVALILSHQSLYPDKTVYENMSVSLRLCETPASKITGKIKRMTAALDIADLLLKKPDELSEEETLKVLIARAAVREPEVLIMDHPFTGEDLNERLKYLDVLEKMHQKLKLTMIVLSEDRYIAKNFPGRIVILNNGVIQQIGEASSVFAHPKNLFAASFLTLPQMSTLLGVIRLEGDDYFVELGEQRILVPGKEKLHRHIGKEVLVGIRPETVRLQKDGETYQYTGTAQRVENTVYGEQVTIDNGHFTITAPNDMHVFEGEKIGFTFLGESILLFDKGTERNIL